MTFNVTSIANGDIQADELITKTTNIITRANAKFRLNAQLVNEIKSGQGKVINSSKSTY